VKGSCPGPLDDGGKLGVVFFQNYLHNFLLVYDN